MMQAQWRALEHAYNTGRTRAIGVSNYCTGCLQCLNRTATVRPHINQLLVHVGMGGGADPGGLLSDTRRFGAAVQAYRPLAQGGGIGRLLAEPSVQDIAHAHGKSAAQVRSHRMHRTAQPLPCGDHTVSGPHVPNRVALAASGAHVVFPWPLPRVAFTWPLVVVRSGWQVALRWVLQLGHALTTTTENVAHMRADLDLFDDFELTEEEMGRLNRLDTVPNEPSIMCHQRRLPVPPAGRRLEATDHVVTDQRATASGGGPGGGGGQD